jgi:hypothetical protein
VTLPLPAPVTTTRPGTVIWNAAIREAIALAVRGGCHPAQATKAIIDRLCKVTATVPRKD